MSITELDEATISRIAAGEVATDPAAVVAELVDNSLDAGASRVEVGVEGDGTDRVRVRDDGHGMTRADAALAVERHTTSKIDDADDVQTVGTLGFRGEALPSIAAAGRLELTTRTAGDDAGTRVVVDGGTTVERAPHGVGTTVEVTGLFADLPARRASLAGPKREFAKVSEVVTGRALARPGVRVRLEHDGRRVLSTPGDGLDGALAAVYDREVAGAAAVVDGGDADITVSGRACRPSVTRADRSHVHVAVNRRALREATVADAVEAGYGSLLPDDRHPVAVVHVGLPPEAVDVNVHPAKEAVAFADAEAVRATVTDAVRDALTGTDAAAARAVETELDALDPAGEGPLDDLDVIGRFHETYLLCERDDELLVVDQHAAHERVVYERLRAALDGPVESVPVDPPATVSLTPSEGALTEAFEGALADLGFGVERFGGETYRVTAVPSPLGSAAAPEDIQQVLTAVRDGEHSAPRDGLLREAACHPAVRAGDDLDGEGETLVAALSECEAPGACPHGRPTVLRLEETDLAREFGRPNTRL
jgi:DNA mismatch repair protein MutL